ncbi:discoidin domain-containing protein [Streptomyces sp. NPDC060031]|uniref:discoidin domain-containing protein n=1 Tax=Streptomyces sp. NPDC060031 TaxID=3347043 RepID=UPI0036807CE7
MVVEFKVTAIEDTAALRVRSLAIPDHTLVSVRSDQPGAVPAAANMHTATTGTGDTFTALKANTPVDPAAVTVMYGLANTGKLAAAIDSNSLYDSPSGGTARENGRIGSTIWHTRWYTAAAPMPHEITLDLGASYNVSDLHYLPRQTQSNGRIADYQVFTSTDGVTWGTAAASRTFADSTAQQDVSFTARTARYVKLKATREVGGNAWTSVAELNIGYRP